MRKGDQVTVRVNGALHGARVLRILDRRGREVLTVSEDDLPPFTTVVLSIQGFEHERVCVPLWVEDAGVHLERLVA